MRNFESLCAVFKRPANAVAFVTGSDKYPSIVGRVLFYNVRGGVIVRAEFSGLPRGNGECINPIFAFHIHSGTECKGNETDAFADVGSHYNPNDCMHPYHAGDMPPLFSANGIAYCTFLTDRFTLREVLGKAVIVHAMPDDFMTQPSGNAGEKIACGIITPTAR